MTDHENIDPYEFIDPSFTNHEFTPPSSDWEDELEDFDPEDPETKEILFRGYIADVHQFYGLEANYSDVLNPEFLRALIRADDLDLLQQASQVYEITAADILKVNGLILALESNSPKILREFHDQYGFRAQNLQQNPAYDEVILEASPGILEVLDQVYGLPKEDILNYRREILDARTGEKSKEIRQKIEAMARKYNIDLNN